MSVAEWEGQRDAPRMARFMVKSRLVYRWTGLGSTEDYSKVIHVNAY
jgi:hypothetical protein